MEIWDYKIWNRWDKDNKTWIVNIPWYIKGISSNKTILFSKLWVFRALSLRIKEKINPEGQRRKRKIKTLKGRRNKKEIRRRRKIEKRIRRKIEGIGEKRKRRIRSKNKRRKKKATRSWWWTNYGTRKASENYCINIFRRLSNFK